MHCFRTYHQIWLASIFFIEGLYVGSINRAIILDLNLFSRLAGPKKIRFSEKKKRFLQFFHIYFEDGIMTAGLNVALTMLYQYLKINPHIQLYFSTYKQEKYF